MLHSMLLAYVDESGDTGNPTKSGSTSCFSLGCVLVRQEDWSHAFDSVLTFRRSVRDNFGPLMRQELKANYLIRNSGGLRRYGLAPAQRRLIYNYHLNTLAAIKARAFAVVVDKQSAGVVGDACLEMAWVSLLQRLERTTKEHSEDVIVIHDEGEDAKVRKILRKSRRHMTAGSMFGGGTFSVPLTRLIEDPVPRRSSDSYFLQTADLVAYAGWRTYMAPGQSVSRVVDAVTWSQLGSATLTKVNKHAQRGVPGVVLRY